MRSCCIDLRLVCLCGLLPSSVMPVSAPPSSVRLRAAFINFNLRETTRNTVYRASPEVLSEARKSQDERGVVRGTSRPVGTLCLCIIDA